jgi:hypothetical protein
MSRIPRACRPLWWTIPEHWTTDRWIDCCSGAFPHV